MGIFVQYIAKVPNKIKTSKSDMEMDLVERTLSQRL